MLLFFCLQTFGFHTAFQRVEVAGIGVEVITPDAPNKIAEKRNLAQWMSLEHSPLLAIDGDPFNVCLFEMQPCL